MPSNNEDLTEEISLKNSRNIIQEKFSFQPVSVKDVENVIKNIPIDKASGGDTPIQIFKQSRFTYHIFNELYK